MITVLIGLWVTNFCYLHQQCHLSIQLWVRKQEQKENGNRVNKFEQFFHLFHLDTLHRMCRPCKRIHKVCKMAIFFNFSIEWTLRQAIGTGYIMSWIKTCKKNLSNFLKIFRADDKKTKKQKHAHIKNETILISSVAC